MEALIVFDLSLYESINWRPSDDKTLIIELVEKGRERKSMTTQVPPVAARVFHRCTQPKPVSNLKHTKSGHDGEGFIPLEKTQPIINVRMGI